MLSRAMTRVGLLLLGIPAGLVSLPADLTGQDPTVQPPRTISVWIEEARASPFHGLIPVGTPENPSVESAVGVSGGNGTACPSTSRKPTRGDVLMARCPHDVRTSRCDDGLVAEAIE